MTWFLLGPGPSMSAILAERVRDSDVGAVGNAYQLVPWAKFVCSTDAAWWRAYPDASTFAGRKFSPSIVKDVEKVRTPLIGSSTNSGVLGLECCKRLGADRIVMLGFDFGAGHFFGDYTNGLRNTHPARRKVHAQQFRAWKLLNPQVQVLNATPNSKLDVFPMVELDDVLCLA